MSAAQATVQLPHAGTLGVAMPPLRVPTLERLSASCLRAMQAHGEIALECERVLQRGGINLVSEVLREQGEFVEYDHYPRDDVYDADTRSQYYFHSHRSAYGEHGHFHTFLRPPAPDGRKEIKEEDDNIVHLIAISMDDYGWPMGLFATNHWVTGGLWRDAGETTRLLRDFSIDHAWPSWPVNRWVGAILGLYRPHIEALLRHRDATISAWSGAYPGEQALENRRLEITAYLPIDVAATVRDVNLRLQLNGL
ncbi:MAG: hypothetical protein AB7E73_03890 [Burkholderiales bacterium]